MHFCHVLHLDRCKEHIQENTRAFETEQNSKVVCQQSADVSGHKRAQGGASWGRWKRFNSVLTTVHEWLSKSVKERDWREITQYQRQTSCWVLRSVRAEHTHTVSLRTHGPAIHPAFMIQVVLEGDFWGVAPLNAYVCTFWKGRLVQTNIMSVNVLCKVKTTH